MQILDSVLVGALMLPDVRDQKDAVWAISHYMVKGEWPEGLRPVAQAVVFGNAPALEKSRAKVMAGKQGGSKPKPTRKANAQAKRKANSQANDKAEQQADAKANEQANGAETREQNPVFCEREEEEELKTPSLRAQGAAPTVEEVAAYAEVCGWAWFDATGFVAYYAARGWTIDGNPEHPVHDWKALATRWHLNDQSGQGRRFGPRKADKQAPGNLPEGVDYGQYDAL